MAIYQSIGDANITTLSGLLVYINSNVPMFIPALLLAFFCIAMLSSYYAQQRMRGYSNFWSCFATSGYITAVISIMMSLIPNLISVYVVLVCIVIAIIGTGMLMTKSSED
jgi:uncharacterized membrane protein HdeD (DUF308 family)